MRIDGLGAPDLPPIKPAAKSAASPFGIKNALLDAVAQKETPADDFSEWEGGENDPRHEEREALETIDDIAARASLNIVHRTPPK